MDRQTAIDTSLAAVGSKATYTGAGTTVVSWMAQNEFGMIAGIVLGILGLIVQIIFKWRQDRREHAEHLERMKDLRKD